MTLQTLSPLIYMPKLVPILICRIPAFDSTAHVDRSYKMSSHEEMRKAVQVADHTIDMARKIDFRMSNMENRMGEITNMISQKLNDNERRRQEELAAMAMAQTVRSNTPSRIPVPMQPTGAVEDRQAELPLSDQEKAGRVVDTAELRSWMTSTRPGAFLLHGHAET